MKLSICKTAPIALAAYLVMLANPAVPSSCNYTSVEASPTPQFLARHLFDSKFGENGSISQDNQLHFLIGSFYDLGTASEPFTHELDQAVRNDRWQDGVSGENFGIATYSYRGVLGFEGYEYTADGVFPFKSDEMMFSVTCGEYCESIPVVGQKYSINVSYNSVWYTLPPLLCGGGYGWPPSEEVMTLFLQCLENDGCPWVDD